MCFTFEQETNSNMCMLICFKERILLFVFCDLPLSISLYVCIYIYIIYLYDTNRLNTDPFHCIHVSMAPKHVSLKRFGVCTECGMTFTQTYVYLL